MRSGRWFACVLVVAAAFSCRPNDQQTDTLDPEEAMQARENMPPAVLAQLDSGSSAFRSHDFEAALLHYSKVTEIAPELGAGWFGVYMVQDALGNEQDAAEALARARALVPGATLIRDGDGGAAR